jgi:hypothetical protein
MPPDPEEATMTAAVVNVLTFTEPVDPAVFARVDDELVPQMRAIDGFEGIHVVRTGDHEVTLVILGRDVGTLDRIATEVGSPWMAANVVPLLAGPPDRHLGPTLVSAGP